MVRPILLAALAVALSGAGPAAAQRDQDDAYKRVRNGEIMQLGDILQRVRPQVGGNFIGSDFDPEQATYRLRFMQSGTVRNVDVDARTGRIINRGNF